MKASGSYASLVHGVSEQVPQQRKPGQVTEQVNLIADPVTGLTRRHGSRWQAEKAMGYDPALIDAIAWLTHRVSLLSLASRTLKYSGSPTVGR